MTSHRWEINSDRTPLRISGILKAIIRRAMCIIPESETVSAKQPEKLDMQTVQRLSSRLLQNFMPDMV